MAVIAALKDASALETLTLHLSQNHAGGRGTTACAVLKQVAVMITSNKQQDKIHLDGPLPDVQS